MSGGLGKISESKFQKEVIRSVKAQFGFAFENKGSSIQRRGIPDLQIQLPIIQSFKNEHFSKEGVLDEDAPVDCELAGGFLWMELKVQDGRVGAHQRSIMEEIQKAGGLAVVTKLHDDGIIKTWEVGKRDIKQYTTMFMTDHFIRGLWLRDIISYIDLEAIAQKRPVKRIPSSYFEAFFNAPPDA